MSLLRFKPLYVATYWNLHLNVSLACQTHQKLNLSSPPYLNERHAEKAHSFPFTWQSCPIDQQFLSILHFILLLHLLSLLLFQFRPLSPTFWNTPNSLPTSFLTLNFSLFLIWLGFWKNYIKIRELLLECYLSTLQITLTLGLHCFLLSE